MVTSVGAARSGRFGRHGRLGQGTKNIMSGDTLWREIGKHDVPFSLLEPHPTIGMFHAQVLIYYHTIP